MTSPNTPRTDSQSIILDAEPVILESRVKDYVASVALICQHGVTESAKNHEDQCCTKLAEKIVEIAKKKSSPQERAQVISDMQSELRVTWNSEYVPARRQSKKFQDSPVMQRAFVKAFDRIFLRVSELMNEFATNEAVDTESTHQDLKKFL